MSIPDNETTATLKLSDSPSNEEYAAAFAHMRRDGTYSPSKGGDGGRGDGGKKRGKDPIEHYTDVKRAADAIRGTREAIQNGYTNPEYPWKPEDKTRAKRDLHRLYQKLRDAISAREEWGATGGDELLASLGVTREKEAGSLTVTKQANGAHRWVAVSSSAYRDRDGEIVSTKALEDDVARADADGNYGPLRWWHVKGLDIGTCDYNAMHGRLLVESGTFNDERVAKAIKEHAPELAVSIGFNHSQHEPDADGVFHTIRRFERSFLPRNRESNLFTTLGAVMKEINMTKDKKDKLAELVGDEVVSDLITQADTTQKAADESGTAFKEFPPKKDDKKKVDDAEESTEDVPDDESTEDMPPKKMKKEQRVKTVGNMSVEDFALAIGTAFQAIVAPVLESQKAAKVEPQPNAEIEALKARLAELEGDMPKFAQKGASVTESDGLIDEILKSLVAFKEAPAQKPEQDRIVEGQMRAAGIAK